ncbi:MAG: hypothetical protein ABIK33_05165 [candidate division WOR-3 bacterium]
MFNILFLIFDFSVTRAGVCNWRFPDKDIQTLFPKATGYKTEVLTYSKTEKVKIESLLGAKLDDDETQFNFYRIYKDTSKIGLVLTHSVKGQYGAIEVVVSLISKYDTITKRNITIINRVLIQRDREVKSKELRGSKFLDQFIGESVKSKFDNIKLVSGAEKSSNAIVFSVRKMLIVQQVLDRERIKPK